MSVQNLSGIGMPLIGVLHVRQQSAVMRYHCHICGKEHGGLPDLGANRPDPFWMVPEEDRYSRIVMTPDTCQIDHSQFYVRGVIRLPIRGAEESFGIGVWVSHREDNFSAYVEHPASAAIGPFFGWLATHIQFYGEETMGLKTMAHYQGDSRRPLIEVEPSAHPLAMDQREGITPQRASEIVHFYLEPKT